MAGIFRGFAEYFAEHFVDCFIGRFAWHFIGHFNLLDILVYILLDKKAMRLLKLLFESLHFERFG